MRYLFLFLLAGCISTPPTAVQPPRQGKLTLLFQSSRLGVLEPCGCHSSPYGGIDREANAVAQIRKTDKVALYIDAGNMLAPPRLSGGMERHRQKAKAMVEMLNTMGLDLFSPGPRDYVLGEEFLAELSKNARFKFISSNVLKEDGRPLFLPFLIEKRDGIRVGLVSITPESPELKSQGLRVLPAARALKSLIGEIKPQTDLIVVLSQFGAKENQELAKKFKDVHLIISSDANHAIQEPFWIGGHTLVLGPGTSGFLLGKLELDIALPFKGFYSERVIEINQRELRAWEEETVKNPKDRVSRDYVSYLKENTLLSPIAGGTVYRHELIQLDKRRFGATNAVTKLVEDEKRQTRQQALKSE